MSWEVKPLGDFSKIMYGYTDSASFNKVGPRFLRITDIQDNGVDWAQVPSCNIGSSELGKYLLTSGDIVFARTGATTGKSFLVTNPPEAVFASYLIRVQINDKKVRPEYLNLYFQSSDYWGAINAGVSGSAQGGFNATKLAGLRIPIPPLPEQQRIVAKLDAAFAALGEAQALVERNRANTRELFESYLNGVHSGYKKDWLETTIGDEVEIATGFAFSSKSYTDNEGDMKLLRGDNIVPGALRWEDVKRWPANEVEEYERYRLDEGDVVIAMDRTWIKGGLKYAILAEKDLPCILVQRTARLRCGPRIDKVYLGYLIGSRDFTTYVLSVQTGLGVPHISGGQIADFSFMIPPLADQVELGRIIKSLEEQTEQLETTYDQKLLELDALKKGLLGAAFRGEL